MTVFELLLSTICLIWEIKWQFATFALAFYIYSNGRPLHFLYLLRKTGHRDVTALYHFVQLMYYVRRSMWHNETVPVLFEKQVRRHPKKTCFIFEDQVWSFREVDEYSNRVANTFLEAGFKRGDVVALFMENRPEYVCMWLGLAKIGVCTALVNTNQRQQPLAHSIKTADSKAVIFGTELTEAVKDVQSLLEENVKYYYSGNAEESIPNSNNLDELLNKNSASPPPKCDCQVTDRLMYIYTSGTTGLPKPAIIPHSRYILAAALKFMIGLREHDVVYNTLPLYHSAGGIMGAGFTLIFGPTSVIRKRFSASKFWDDCVKHQCTCALYIGEICRYLLSQKPREVDTQHKVRVIVGPGLRPHTWEPFVERFRIRDVRELYASTEGNTNIMNTDNHPKAIGFISQLIPSTFYPVTLIKVNEETGEPVRDGRGMCVMCAAGEVGEIVGKIRKGDPLRDFSGYVSEEATKKKIIKDVFNKGDYSFSSGDLLMMDELGYVYFKDRTGDTFRWKGENVSTTEVETVISGLINYKACVVYGVSVPECEGRAGMVAILDDDDSLDLNGLSSNMQKSLPPYAVPIFIRIVPKLDMTGTYKLRKVDLQKQGFGLDKKEEKVYYLDKKSGNYCPLDQEMYDKIAKGEQQF